MVCLLLVPVQLLFMKQAHVIQIGLLERRPFLCLQLLYLVLLLMSQVRGQRHVVLLGDLLRALRQGGMIGDIPVRKLLDRWPDRLLLRDLGQRLFVSATLRVVAEKLPFLMRQ